MNQKEEIQLYPDPLVPGKFDLEENGIHKNAKGFLHPSNWVFHKGVYIPVLEGRYDKIKPFSAEIVPTMNCPLRCNLPCSFEEQKIILGCWDHNYFSSPETHMQNTTYARNLINKLHEGGVKGLIFTGGGDPFLYKNLGDIMKYAEVKEMDKVLYTNGVAVSKNQLEKVMESNPLLIRVSLNAFSKDVYNKFHNPFNKNNSHEKAWNNFEMIVEMAKYNYDTEVGAAFVVDEKNKDDLVNCANELANIKQRTNGDISVVAIRPRYHYRGGKQLEKEILKEIFENVERNVRPILEKVGIPCNNVKPRYDSLLDQKKKFTKCRASRNYGEIAPNGKNHLCCDNNAHPDWETGNLNEQTLDEIFESEEYAKILKKVNDTNCDICPPGCKPHLTNIQYDEVERKRANGEIHEVELWVEKWNEYEKPRMVNF